MVCTVADSDDAGIFPHGLPWAVSKAGNVICLICPQNRRCDSTGHTDGDKHIQRMVEFLSGRGKQAHYDEWYKHCKDKIEHNGCPLRPGQLDEVEFLTAFNPDELKLGLRGYHDEDGEWNRGWEPDEKIERELKRLEVIMADNEVKR